MILEDGVVVAEVDEFTGLRVLPVQGGHAGPEIRLYLARAIHRQKAHDRGYRNHPQPQVLLDLGEISVHEVSVDAWNRPSIEPRAETQFHAVIERDVPLAVDGRAAKILDVERQRLQVFDEHIVGPTRCATVEP